MFFNMQSLDFCVFTMHVNVFFFSCDNKKMSGGWRDQITGIEVQTPTDIVESYLHETKADTQTMGITFGVTCLIVYFILILTRPSVVVYRDKNNQVPTFHHGAAFLWSVVFGGLSVGLLQYC